MNVNLGVDMANLIGKRRKIFVRWELMSHQSCRHVDGFSLA
jgi:hypothetical protein